MSKVDWRENIPVQGILCWVSNSKLIDRKLQIELVVAYLPDYYRPFHTLNNIYFNALPLTKEEVLERLLEVEDD